MRELVFFEYKKMMKRKSVWISVCAMLFVVLLCSNLSLLGSVYVDDHKVFSHFEEIQIRREGGEKLEGAVLEEGFLEKNVEEYEVYLADRDSGKITWENYQTVQEEVASAQLLSWWVERLALDSRKKCRQIIFTAGERKAWRSPGRQQDLALVKFRRTESRMRELLRHLPIPIVKAMKNLLCIGFLI